MPPMTLEDFSKLPPQKAKPASCGHVLDILDKEGRYKIGENEVCADCYFEAMGKLIDEHPIGRPTPHGGCC